MDEMILSRKERDRQRNKEAIMEAAVHLFAQNGYVETKLDEIAALAEFGKGTLYNYFKNKDDLLLCAFEYALSKVTAYLEEQLTNVEDPIERLNLIVRAQFNYYRDNEDFLKVVFANQHLIGQTLREKAGTDLHRRFMQLRHLLIVEIKAAIQAGQIKPGKAERYASYLSGMIHSQIRSLNQKELKIEDLQPDEIVDIFLYGASND